MEWGQTVPRENATGQQGSWDQYSEPKEIRVRFGGRPGKKPNAEPERLVPASLPPQWWVPGQLCPGKTDVLWA